MIDPTPELNRVILGLGTALPKFSIQQADAAQIVADLGITNRWNRAIPQLYKASGVERRGSVLLQSDVGPPVDRQDFFKPVRQTSDGIASPQPTESPIVVPAQLPGEAFDPSDTPTRTPADVHASRNQKDKGPGTRERMLAFEQYSTALAIQASERALAIAEIHPNQITHLITVSCSGFSAPGIDFALIETLGLSHSVLRTNVGFMGCHAAINAMRVADSIVAANPAANVLLCAVELCSLHQQYSEDPQQLVANSLFADGAAAIIVCSREAHAIQHSGVSESSGESGRWSIVDSASTWIPNTTDMMSWKIGDNGFQMTLSPKVPSVIESQLKAWMVAWLDNHALQIEQIDRWIIHPGGPKILDACGVSLDLPPTALEPSRACLRDNGNMSSPTVLFILESCGQPIRGDLAVMLGFGPGLAIEAALLRAV